ncbi:MAG: DUF692 family protein [Gammaproteobacteria bacterium]|nr:DUF692 family protein [Gammaproteobacteria bacterium]
MNLALEIEKLPALGLGASLSLSSLPDPVKLVEAKGGPSFVEYAGQVDVDRVISEVERVKQTGVPVLFHPSFINFCGSHVNNTSWLETTAEQLRAVASPWFAQDCAYCFWEGGPGYSTQLGYFIPPVLNEQSLQRAIERVKEVQSVVPVSVAIEPPPLSFVVGNMHLLDFFGELARACDCAILLDMGHLVSYEMASARKLVEAFNGFPFERVVEVHVAGGKLRKGETGPIYIDAHESSILDQTWAMLDNILPRLPTVRAVCYECEGVDEPTVLNTLERIRTVLLAQSVSPELLLKLQEKQ